MQNLIIACMFREMNKPSRAGMAELYDVMRTENIVNVRYT